MRNNFIYTLILACVIVVSSCCDPSQKASNAEVIYGSYSDTAIKDFPVIVNLSHTDSVYYPIYSLDIRNSGSEADTFKLVINRGQNTTPLSAQEYIHGGETKTLKTYGPIPKNAPDTSKYRYYSFFVSTPDSVSLKVLRPTISLTFGGTPDGVEQCGSPAKTISISVDSLKKQ